MAGNDYNSPVSFCPNCGSSMKHKESIVIEYWKGEHNVCFSWCHQCSWRGEIIEVVRITTTQVEEE